MRLKEFTEEQVFVLGPANRVSRRAGPHRKSAQSMHNRKEQVYVTHI